MEDCRDTDRLSALGKKASYTEMSMLEQRMPRLVEYISPLTVLILELFTVKMPYMLRTSPDQTAKVCPGAGHNMHGYLADSEFALCRV